MDYNCYLLGLILVLFLLVSFLCLNRYQRVKNNVQVHKLDNNLFISQGKYKVVKSDRTMISVKSSHPVVRYSQVWKDNEMLGYVVMSQKRGDIVLLGMNRDIPYSDMKSQYVHIIEVHNG